MATLTLPKKEVTMTQPRARTVTVTQSCAVSNPNAGSEPSKRSNPISSSEPSKRSNPLHHSEPMTLSNPSPESASRSISKPNIHSVSDRKAARRKAVAPKKKPPSSEQRQAAVQEKREERIASAITWLEMYHAFAHVLPLAIGAHRQLMAERPKSISGKTLRFALRAWCSSTLYRHALTVSGAMRHNPDGTVAGPVTPVHQK